MTVLDANYILRYLLQDDENMFLQAANVIENERCLLLGEVMAEVIYVLHGYYKVPRTETARALTALLALPNIQPNAQREKYLDALKIFSENSLDYVDCLLCAWGKSESVSTFDKKLQKCLKRNENIQR